jgi:hypothetical protein
MALNSPDDGFDTRRLDSGLMARCCDTIRRKTKIRDYCTVLMGRRMRKREEERR